MLSQEVKPAPARTGCSCLTLRHTRSTYASSSSSLDDNTMGLQSSHSTVSVPFSCFYVGAEIRTQVLQFAQQALRPEPPEQVLKDGHELRKAAGGPGRQRPITLDRATHAPQPGSETVIYRPRHHSQALRLLSTGPDTCSFSFYFVLFMVSSPTPASISPQSPTSAKLGASFLPWSESPFSPLPGLTTDNSPAHSRGRSVMTAAKD